MAAIKVGARNSVQLLCTLVLAWGMALALVSATDPWDVTEYTDTKASFYGGQSARGTMGSSCGYREFIMYGIATASLSNSLFNSGFSCGACFEISCKAEDSASCYPGRSVVVTATDACGQTTHGGGPCDSPTATHFLLSAAVFQKIAQPDGGMIPAQYKRVPCVRQGGIRFTIHGSLKYITILVHNVAGGGDVQALSIKATNTRWSALNHSWGQLWAGVPAVYGHTLSFKATLGNGKTKEFHRVVPAGWEFGQTFEATTNFS